MDLQNPFSDLFPLSIDQNSSPFDLPAFGTPASGSAGTQRGLATSAATPHVDQCPILAVTLPLLQLPDWNPDEVYDADRPTDLFALLPEMEGYYHEPSGMDRKSAKRRSGAPPILGEDPSAADTRHLGQKGFRQDGQTGRYRGDGSINDRTQKSLTKHFSGTDEDWSDIDKQLILWGRQFQVAKKRLQVSVTFHHKKVEVNQKGKTTGRGTVTQRMLCDLAEEEAQQPDQTALWRDLYERFRCRRATCPFGLHCLEDSDTGRTHYPLRAPHLKQLILLAKVHGTRAQGLVPQTMRDQLYAEAKERRASKANGRKVSIGTGPPVYITNVLPKPHDSPSSPSDSTPPARPFKRAVTELLEIDGPLDVTLDNYCKWQQERVVDESWKADWKKVYDVLKASRCDLRLMYKEQDYSALTNQDVPVWIAKRCLQDIPVFAR